VVYPCGIPKDTNSKNRDIPIIISPFKIGILLTKLIALRARGRRLNMPIAVILPSKVDTVAAIKAMLKVLTKAFVNE
jgi:hypothetical protein